MRTDHVWRRARRALRRVWEISGRVHLGLIAAGVAFFGIFALVPGLAALIALFGIFADPQVVEAELELMQEVIPQDAYLLLADQVDRLLAAPAGTLGWATVLSLLVAFWSAQAGVSALVQGVNAVYGIPGRSGLWHILFSLLMTATLIGIAIVALLVVVVAPIVLSFVPLAAEGAALLFWLRWGAALVVLVAALALLYRFGPNRRLTRGFTTPGALAVVLVWLGMSAAFSEYLANFNTYNRLYGSIGAVAATLMWFYLSAYLVLLGAALNVVIEGADHRQPPARAPRAA